MADIIDLGQYFSAHRSPSHIALKRAIREGNINIDQLNSEEINQLFKCFLYNKESLPDNIVNKGKARGEMTCLP